MKKMLAHITPKEAKLLGPSVSVNKSPVVDYLRRAGQENIPEDSVIAKLSPVQALFLKDRGGAGTTDPITGLLHFYDGDTGNGSEGSASGGTGDSGDDSDSDSGSSSSDGWGDGWSDSLGDIGASLGESLGGWGDVGADIGASLGDSFGDVSGSSDLGFSTNPMDYMDEISPDVAPTSALAEQAIADWAANPESWADSFGNVMGGQPSGFFSDLADWASREGLYSQPGAGQVGALDNVDVSGVLGGLAGLTMGPLAGLATKAGVSFLSDLTKGVDPTVGLGNTLGKSAAGFLGSMLGNTVSPGLGGAIGSQLGKAGFSWAQDNLGPAPAADPGAALGQTSDAQVGNSFGSNNTFGNSKNLQTFLYGAGGALTGNYLASYGGSLNNMINNVYGNNSMATNTNSGSNLFGDMASLFPYVYGATDNRRQEDAEGQLSGLSKYQDLLGQSYINPQSVYDKYYKPIDTMFNQQQIATDAAAGRGTDNYKRDVAREANFYNYLGGMQNRLADLGYGSAQQNYFNKTQQAANDQSGNTGALLAQMFGNRGQGGSLGSNVVGGVTSGDYYNQLQKLFGGDTSTGFWDDIGSWFGDSGGYTDMGGYGVLDDSTAYDAAWDWLGNSGTYDTDFLTDWGW